METLLRQPAAVAALWVLATLGLNGFIFAMGWNTSGEALRPSWAPPGALIGAVWMGLFALVGYAHGLLVAQSNLQHWGHAAYVNGHPGDTLALARHAHCAVVAAAASAVAFLRRLLNLGDVAA